jgi:septum formation protein
MLILASNSPRRKWLLGFGGLTFQVSPAQVDERLRAEETPRDYVLRLAVSKARAVGAQAPRRAVVLAADTSVVHQGQILGKPVDPQQAEAMLRRLRGEEHLVYTALALLRVADDALVTDLCVTEVPMRLYSDEEMRTYIASGDPMDKAGAYAIQHPGFKPVENLAGCYANVVGLPLCHLTRALAKFDVSFTNDIPLTCQNNLDYDCPVYRRILRGEI